MKNAELSLKARAWERGRGKGEGGRGRGEGARGRGEGEGGYSWGI